MRIVFIILYIYMTTAVGAEAQGVSADPAHPIYDDKGIPTFHPTFRPDDGMTEMERMIAENATTCLTQWEEEGKTFYHPTQCAVVERLRAALSKTSETESLLQFLDSNDFRCQKAIHETRCRNEFRTIETFHVWNDKKDVSPFHIGNISAYIYPFIWNEKKDIYHTFITEVVFKQAKPGPLPVDDINVKFTHFEKLETN